MLEKLEIDELTKMAKEVRKVMDKNKAERHIRGGEATRARYLNQ